MPRQGRCLNPMRPDPPETRPSFFDKHLSDRLNTIIARASGATHSRPRRQRRGTSLNGSDARKHTQRSRRAPTQPDVNSSSSEPARVDQNLLEGYLSNANYPVLTQRLEHARQEQLEISPPTTTTAPYQELSSAEQHVQSGASFFTAPNTYSEEVGASIFQGVGGYMNYATGTEFPPSLYSAPPHQTTGTDLFQIRGVTTAWRQVPTSYDIRWYYTYITPSLATSLGAQLIPLPPSHSFQEIRGPPCTHYVTGISFAYEFSGRLEFHNLTIRVLADDNHPVELYIGRALMTLVLNQLPSSTNDNLGH